MFFFMVALMKEPLVAAARIVPEVIVDVADIPMFACSVRDDAIAPCSTSAMPRVVVGLAPWVVTAAV